MQDVTCDGTGSTYFFISFENSLKHNCQRSFSKCSTWVRWRGSRFSTAANPVAFSAGDASTYQVWPYRGEILKIICWPSLKWVMGATSTYRSCSSTVDLVPIGKRSNTRKHNVPFETDPFVNDTYRSRSKSQRNSWDTWNVPMLLLRTAVWANQWAPLLAAVMKINNFWIVFLRSHSGFGPTTGHKKVWLEWWKSTCVRSGQFLLKNKQSTQMWMDHSGLYCVA